ncbi:hypothetical protein WD019_02665 [Fictibacillus sp. Mic-4]|uniref:hypothetical protein n=1 Tax=Fictibacillus TaxID=1329200 RepID=UPI0003FF4D67|nr:hypothetical protein [Fictibacillus gelatini]
MNNKGYGDGFGRNRLFLNSLISMGLDVQSYYFIKWNVCMVETRFQNFVLKGFQSKDECKNQLELSNWFSQFKDPSIGTYTIYPNRKRIMYSENMYWGIMPYYSGSGLDLKYFRDVKHGLRCIHEFHKQSTLHGTGPLLASLPTYNLYKKWKKRHNKFVENVTKTRVSDSMRNELKEMMKWGKWSLEHLPKTELIELENSARQHGYVCHGDVAPHNFIRLSEKKVILIDYDLLSVVPHEYDYLQYVNRCMPYWNWSNQLLKKLNHAVLESCLEKRWFLIALVFPTDLYREWNRVLERRNKNELSEMIRFTKDDFGYRKKFIEKLMKELS